MPSAGASVGWGGADVADVGGAAVARYGLARVAATTDGRGRIADAEAESCLAFEVDTERLGPARKRRTRSLAWRGADAARIFVRIAEPAGHLARLVRLARVANPTGEADVGGSGVLDGADEKM